MADSVTGILTGGLLDPGSPNYAKLAKANEARRKGIINLGLGQINSVFGGGTSPFYKVPETGFTSKAWHAGGKQQPFYYLSGKGKFEPYFVPNKKNLGDAGATGAKIGLAAGSIVPGIGNVVGASAGGLIGNLSQGDYKGAALSAGTGGMSDLLKGFGLFGSDDVPTERELINKQIRRGNLFYAPEYQTFEGFQQPFFDKRAQDYVNFALPQLADQYRQNRSAMLFGLSNRGLSNSTVAKQANQQIERAAGTGRQQIAETGIQQANALKQDVENARQTAINQLYQTGDPSQAVSSAINTASQLRMPSTFAPIADAFSGIARSYYTNQLLNSYRLASGNPASSPTYSLAGPVSGPVTY